MAFVIRARYCQPDGIGWVTEDAGVSHDPSYAHRFDSEADAWIFIGCNYEKLGAGGEDCWPEEAKDYTPEERRAILDEVQQKHDAYYRFDDEDGM